MRDFASDAAARPVTGPRFDARTRMLLEASIPRTLLRLATVELLRPHMDTSVNVINVEHLAKQRRPGLIAGR